MNKKISTERLYSLGDFKNIKFFDEISDIPDEISNNKEATKLLRYLQLLEIEFAYSRYMLLMEKLYSSKLPIDEILTELEKERSIVFADLLKVINNHSDSKETIKDEAGKVVNTDSLVK